MVRYLRRKRGIALIPTLLTLGNGFCGFVAISKALDAVMVAGTEAFGDKLTQAAWLIFLAMVFDALDGRVARLTKQTTEFGEQLDSFTDLISFGVAPAILVKTIYEQTLNQVQIAYSAKLTLLLTALYAICSVLRLARFTLDTSQEESSHRRFCGLPTPAAAGMIASYVLFLFEGTRSLDFMTDPALLFTLKRLFLFFPPVLGLLMVSKFEYVHVFNRFVRGRRTFNYLIQGVLCLFVLAFWYEWAILLCFTLYLLSGPVSGIVRYVERLFTGKKAEKSSLEDRE